MSRSCRILCLKCHGPTKSKKVITTRRFSYPGTSFELVTLRHSRRVCLQCGFRFIATIQETVSIRPLSGGQPG